VGNSAIEQLLSSGYSRLMHCSSSSVRWSCLCKHQSRKTEIKHERQTSVLHFLLCS
jgi:hypothetical protein